MAKKIIALVAAIALVVCFAVSASAINIATTTQYVSGTSDIKVNVTVTGIDTDDNVTYYAYDEDYNPVHIDQAKATAQGATFQFNTLETNLGSNVIVGYTGGEADDTATIKGYTVTYPNGSKVIPTEATTVTISYTPTAGKVLDEVTVTAGTATVLSATPTANAGEVSVTFASALTGNVTLAVTEKIVKEAATATAEVIDAAAIVATDKIDGTVNGDERNPDDHEDTIAANANKAGDRKLTVIGKVASAQAYGIVVSEAAITSGAVSAEDFATMTSYAGVTKDATTGVFAIQLIDTSDAGSAESFVKADTNYYTAVYALDANGDYIITAHATAVKATVAAN